MTGMMGTTTRTYVTSLCLSPELEAEVLSLVNDLLEEVYGDASVEAGNKAKAVNYLKNYWPKRLRNKALSLVTDEVEGLQKGGRDFLEGLKSDIEREWNGWITGVGTPLGGQGRTFVSSAQKLFGCSTNESSSSLSYLASAWNNKVNEVGKFIAFSAAVANADRVALANYLLTGYVTKDVTGLLRGPDDNGPRVPFHQAVGWLNGMGRSKNMPALFDRVVLKEHESVLRKKISIPKTTGAEKKKLALRALGRLQGKFLLDKFISGSLTGPDLDAVLGRDSAELKKALESVRVLPGDLPKVAHFSVTSDEFIASAREYMDSEAEKVLFLDYDSREYQRARGSIRTVTVLVEHIGVFSDLLSTVFASKKYFGALASIISARLPEKKRRKCYPELVSVVSAVLAGKFRKELDGFLGHFTAENAVTPPMCSDNEKGARTKDVLPLMLNMGAKYVVKRPGNKNIIASVLAGNLSVIDGVVQDESTAENEGEDNFSGDGTTAGDGGTVSGDDTAVTGVPFLPLALPMTAGRRKRIDENIERIVENEATHLARKVGVVPDDRIKARLRYILPQACVMFGFRPTEKMSSVLKAGASECVLRLMPPQGPSRKIHVHASFNGTVTAFVPSTRFLTADSATRLPAKKVMYLAVDKNRVGSSSVAFGSEVGPEKKPPAYEKYFCALGTHVKNARAALSAISEHIDSVESAGNTVKRDRAVTERKMIQRRLKNVRKENVLASGRCEAVMCMKLGPDFFLVEDVVMRGLLKARGRKKAVNIAVTDMAAGPASEKYAIACLEAAGVKVPELKAFPAAWTSQVHAYCGGRLNRSGSAYDVVICKKCGATVDTHENAPVRGIELYLKRSENPDIHGSSEPKVDVPNDSCDNIAARSLAGPRGETEGPNN